MTYAIIYTADEQTWHEYGGGNVRWTDRRAAVQYALRCLSLRGYGWRIRHIGDA